MRDVSFVMSERFSYAKTREKSRYRRETNAFRKWMCTLIKAGELTEADLPKSFCGDDSLSSSDGEYGSAMANRPPRVYISPARLCDSRTLHVRPHPRNRFPPLSPIRHRSILVQSHVPVYYRHGSSCSVPVVAHEFRVRVRTRTRISYLDYQRRAAAAGISEYRCIPQVLAPENFRGLTPLINYRRWLTALLVDRLLNGSCDENATDIFFSHTTLCTLNWEVYTVHSIFG